MNAPVPSLAPARLHDADAIVGGLPVAGWSAVAGQTGIFLFSAEKDGIGAGWSGLRLPGLERFIVLERYRPWWLRPAWGDAESAVPAAECQLVLWRRTDGRWGALVPTTDGNHRAWFQGGADGLALRVRGEVRPDESERLLLAVAAIGDDPAAVVAAAVEAGMADLRTARPRTAKALPEWVDSFGWCTWDAFRQEVSAEKVEQGLAAFARDGLRVPLLIVDDGWQQERDAQLLSFTADPVKFPGGLAPLVATAKERYGVRTFGVWHALAGYWNGVHADGELAREYRLCPSFHGAYNVPEGKNLDRSLVHPDDAARFFQDFHAQLAAEGVDLVKVDNQASLDHFTEGLLPDYQVVATYQQALQGSVAVHFGNNLLHCMAMSGDIAWRLASSAVWRNSDDYYPEKPESHGFHLAANAANALWASAFALPDWDMFHSGHAAGWFHGAARAISGGPVYISDVPGKHDAELVRALTLADGRVPRPPHPARVADSRILIDCVGEDRLLLVRNRTATGFLLGAFHCRHTATPIADTWCASDAGASGQVVVHGFRSDRCELMHASAANALALDPLGWEVFTVAPLVDGIAVLGLAGKLAGGAAVLRADRIAGMVCCDLLCGGELRVWSAFPLSAYTADGSWLHIRNAGGGVRLISVPEGTTQGIVLRPRCV